MLRNRIKELALILAIAIFAIGLAPISARAALLTVTTIDENAPVANIATSAVSASAGGDTAVNNGNMFLYVKNGSASSVTVTVTPNTTTYAVPGGLGVVTVSAVTDVIPASDEGILGPFPVGPFNNGGNGQISITYSSATSVTIAPFALARH